jgi:6-phosphogluconolactonase
MTDEVTQSSAFAWQPHPVWHEGADAHALAQVLADWVAERLREGLFERGQATLVVSGGSTPVLFFQALRERELDWARVIVTLVDERAVPASHADSNERLVRAHLLQSKAASAQWWPCFTNELRPDDPADLLRACAELDARLARLCWPVDVIVLGMGSDGHTASLFARAPELMQALSSACTARCIVADVPPAPNVPVRRLSWAPSALLQARNLAVHTTGGAKRELLQRACASGDVLEWPIRLALWQDRVPCHLFHAD